MEAECAALRNMVEERNTFITTMKTEIYRKEYKNDTERVDLHSQILQKDAIIKKLEVSVKPQWLATLFLFLRTSSPGHPSEDVYVTVLDSQNFIGSKHAQCLVMKVFMFQC